MPRPQLPDSYMFRVVVRQGDIEHVFVTANTDERSAKVAVLRHLGLSGADVACGVERMTSDNLPTRLYTINTKTGDMS